LLIKENILISFSFGNVNEIILIMSGTT
jgi:hypothetical protein